jgi:ATP-dependent Lon protease
VIIGKEIMLATSTASTTPNTKVVQEEIERYESMPSNSSEANIIKQYVD